MAVPETPPADPGLSAALARAVAEQRAFEERRATRLGQGTEALTGPIGGMLARIIPPGMVREALRQADRAAGITIRRFCRHDVADLAACDAAALRAQAWAQGTSAATGGAVGVAGAAGMALDIPATIALAARTVRATGAAYGYAGDGEEERVFRLMVLEASRPAGHAPPARQPRAR